MTRKVGSWGQCKMPGFATHFWWNEPMDADFSFFPSSKAAVSIASLFLNPAWVWNKRGAHPAQTHPLLQVVVGLVGYLGHDHQGSYNTNRKQRGRQKKREKEKEVGTK